VKKLNLKNLKKIDRGAFQSSSLEEVEDFETQAYDVIEIEKSKIKDTDKHIYIAVRVWDDESGGFKVKDVEGQGAFEKQNATKIMQSYTTEVNIEKLINGQSEDLEIKLPIKKGVIECLTYKVKIR